MIDGLPLEHGDLTIPHSSDQASVETQVIARAKAGDRNAFSSLYERYSRDIYRYLFAQTRHQQDAEDLVVEVFLRAWRFLPRYEEKGYPFSAFLYSIARNALVDHFRSINVQHQHIIPVEDPVERNAFDDVTPENRRMRLDAHTELYQALLNIREDYRDVLILRFINGYNPAEAASAMGRSEGAVRVLQHRALRALRTQLNDDEIESILEAL